MTTAEPSSAPQAPPKRRGRPEVPADRRKSAMIRARVSDVQAQTWEALGGAEWVRPLLDRERKRLERAQSE